MFLKINLNLKSLILIPCISCILCHSVTSQNNIFGPIDSTSLELSARSGIYTNVVGLEKFLKYRHPKGAFKAGDDISTFSAGGDFKLLFHIDNNSLFHLNVGYLYNSYQYNDIETSVQSTNFMKNINTTLRFNQHNFIFTFGPRFYFNGIDNAFRKYLQLEIGINALFAYSIKRNSTVRIEDKFTEVIYHEKYEYYKYINFNDRSGEYSYEIGTVSYAPFTAAISVGTEIPKFLDHTFMIELGAQFNYQYYSHDSAVGIVQYDKIDLIYFLRFGMRLFN